MAGVLAEHEPHLTKLARDFAAIKKANTRLQGEVRCLKDTAAEDKKTGEASREELAAVKEELKAENQGLLASMKG